MGDQQREIIRTNYNAIAKRVADEQFALFPNYAFDPVQLAHHVDLVIDELKRQRDQAWATLHTIERVAVVNGNPPAQEVTP